MKRTATRYWIAILLPIIVVAGVCTLWYYMTSFTSVVFSYDVQQGTIELQSANKHTHIAPKSGEAVRLQKGEYTITKHGKDIATDPQTITIDNSISHIPIKFSYTQSYLDDRLSTERAAITSAINSRYPAVSEIYTISHQKLYGNGEWFGATLVSKNTNDDNRDTLHILLHKEDSSWRVTSTPPRPVLTKIDYPQAPVEILKQINRAK